MKTVFFILTVIYLATAVSGYGDLRFQSNEKPEDKVIVLETLKESPKSYLQNCKIGDDVAIIRDDGVLDVSGRIEEVGGKLIYAAAPYLNRGGNEIWMPFEQAVNVRGDEKIAAQGCKVRTGEGRFIKSEWFPLLQVFPCRGRTRRNQKSAMRFIKTTSAISSRIKA